MHRHVTLCRVALSIAALAATLAVALPSVQAAPPTPLPSGPALGIAHTHDPHEQPAAVQTVRGASSTWYPGRSGAGQLTYHGGPINETQTTYAIFWSPSNAPGSNYWHNSASDASAYLYTQETEASNDPITGGSDFTITQYCSGAPNGSAPPCAGAGRQTHYGITSPYYHAAGLTDYDAAPASGCPVATPPGFTLCLTQAQVQNEINAVRTAQGWPSGRTNAYVIYLPDTMAVCQGTTTSSCFGYVPGICAFHSYAGTQASPTFTYAVIPWSPGSPNHGCDNGSYPLVAQSYAGTITTMPPADMMANLSAHELRETATDPVGNGWYNSANGMEADDQCNFLFGGAQGQRYGQNYNNIMGQNNSQVGGLHYYWVQGEWSNAANNGLNGGGCVNSNYG